MSTPKVTSPLVSFSAAAATVEGQLRATVARFAQNRGLVGRGDGAPPVGSRRPVLNRDELRAAALLGLWRAHRSYDPVRNPVFWAYAKKFVVGQILRDLSQAGTGLSSSTDELVEEVAVSGDNPEEQVGTQEVMATLCARTASQLTPREAELIAELRTDPSLESICARRGWRLSMMTAVQRSALDKLKRASKDLGLTSSW